MNSQQALQNLQNYQSQMMTPDQYLSKAQGELGVQGANQQVQGLRGTLNQTTALLNNIAPSVMGRTGNSLVTSAQANRIIQNEQAPVQANLSKNTQDLSQAMQDYQNLEQQAESRAQAGLQGQQNQISYLQGIYNDILDQEKQAEAIRQFNANLAEQQRQFNASLAKSSSGGIDLGGLFGNSGGSAAAPSMNPSSLSSAVNLVNQYKSALGSGANWGSVASALERDLGGKIPTGSLLDQAFHQIFSGGGNTAALSPGGQPYLFSGAFH